MIVTFYSYKGGVGRSMALANTADLLARSGLRVLMVDFDLEAPGLEHFFPIDHDWARGQRGLLDLLLAYKYAMSAASSGNEEQDGFRELGHFITTIYPARSSGGCLDLLSAGQRRTDDQLINYGIELRQFDWLNFYFTWSGELFFEWLRRVFADRYDAVLVDSRTGVTEMGGICAYQLADVIVAFCAPNLQNIDGTETMVRHFLSPAVRAVRRDRPIDVLVVPARIEQEDGALRQDFQRRFDDHFAAYLPSALADAGMSLWDLQIPYEPRYAFDEQVITDPERAEERRGLASAYGRLLDGIALLAPRESPLAGVGHVSGSGGLERAKVPVETRYDPTTRFAAPDVFIWFGTGAAEVASELGALLDGEPGLTAIVSRGLADAGSRGFADLAQRARLGLVLVSADPRWRPWQQAEVEQLRALGRPVTAVLLPGADHSQIPPWLGDVGPLDYSGGVDHRQLLTFVRAALASPSAQPLPTEARHNPYVGLLPFREEDADVFFGREKDVRLLVSKLASDGRCLVVGSAGAGKTSVVSAGLIPALRRGAIPGSERWPVVALRPGRRAVPALTEALAALVSGEPDALDGRPNDPAALNALLRERYENVLLVVDQMEELFTQATKSERNEFFEYLRILAGYRSATATVLRIVIILRSEFLDEQFEYYRVKRLFIDSAVAISPLASDGLRRAIEAPAVSSGVVFEPGLVERLMADTANRPGALPLLQFVLQSLWATQRDGYLTHEAYEITGGVMGALAQRADQVLHRLSPDELGIARDLLLRLITLTDDEVRTRGPVELSDLTSGPESVGHSAAEVRGVIDRLTDGRLLVTSVTNGTTNVEIAHEALITAWPTLGGWIDEKRSALVACSRLDAAVAEWQKQGRDSAWLLTGPRIEQLLSEIGDDIPLSEHQREYLEASRARQRRGNFRVTSWTFAAGTFGAIATGIATALGDYKGYWAVAVPVVVLSVVSVLFGILSYRR